MSLMARMHLQRRLFALMATLASLVPHADAASGMSAALRHCRTCMLSGGVVDLYSQTTGSPLPACLARGLCPPGSKEVHRTCVAPADPWQAREIVVTLQVACDRTCMASNGVDASGTLWLAFARLLRVPLQETHAAMLLMDTGYQQSYPIEYFTLRKSGESLLFNGPGSSVRHSETWDLYIAIRVHTSRAAASGDALRGILRNDASGLTSLVGWSSSRVHVFNSAERRTTSVRQASMLQAMYKLRGLGWNEEPPRITRGSSSSNQGSDSYYDDRRPAPAPAPRPQTTKSTTEAPRQEAVPEPKPRHEGCDRACQYWQIGNGACDAACSNEACGWDGGDCHGQNGGGQTAVTPGCGCSAGWLGNGICESFCNYEACHFDGGDCEGYSQATQAPLPSPTSAPAPPATTPAPACGCNSRWLGDGICDSYCNTEACRFDGGDCPQGRDSSAAGPRPTPAPAPARTVTSRPTPAPAATKSSGNLRATASPPRAFSNGKSQDNTQVVSFDVESDNSAEDDAWRVVATPKSSNDKVSSWYADANGDEDEKARSNPLMSALILAIFFVATACLGGIAICIVTRHARNNQRRLILRPKSSCRTSEGWTTAGWGQPSQSSGAQSANSSRGFGNFAGGHRDPKGSVYSADENWGRRYSKQSNGSQRSWDTASTRTSTTQDDYVSSPSSGGSPAPSRAQGKSRNPLKEPKVHPEPDPAHWTRASMQRRSSEAQRRAESNEFNRAYVNGQRRHSTPDAHVRRESDNLHKAASAEDPHPQPPPPPVPVNFRKYSKLSEQKRPEARSEARSQSKGSAYGHTPRSEPQTSTPSAKMQDPQASQPRASSMPQRSESRSSVPKASEPRASSVPRASRPSASEPKASKPSASEPKASDAKKQAQATAAGSTGRSWFPSWGSKESEPSKKDAGPSPKPAKQKEEPPKRSASAPPAAGKSSSWPWSRNGAAPSSSSSSAASANASSAASRSSSATPQQQQKAAKKAEKKADALTVTTMKKLEQARTQPLEERKKVFRDLQRQLHPDKNIDQADAAKLAFQRLMEQRASFLSA